MNEERIFDGITNIRKDIIERAENYVFSGETKKGELRSGQIKKVCKVKPVWVTVAVAAACLLLVIGTPFVYMAARKSGSSEPPEAAAPGQSLGGSEKPGDRMPETTVAMNNVWIYYVEAGEICREQHFVKLQPADIFELWKGKNGIGAEVQLLDCEIRSNATTSIKDGMAEHVPGDYHRLYLTVSMNLETYYEAVDSELLLESLKQTMWEYSNVQEYHLILE